MQTGIIDCGNMGGGMAKQLLSAGSTVNCYDPSDDVLAAFASGERSAFNGEVIYQSQPRRKTQRHCARH